jgi:uncharacterized integral membrane protein (TIGR00698 family)
MEGVPDWVDPAETYEERLGRAGWRARAHELLALSGALLPGVALAAACAFLGAALAQWIGVSVLGFTRTPLSPILMAILLGLLLRNVAGLPSVYEAGVSLCLKRVLRIGVALLGIRLSLVAVGAIGLSAVPIVVASIATALLLVTWISRLLGLPPRLGILIAAGTAICGNTAIVATGPAIDASEDEVSYAVGTITVFGLLALVTYPFLSHYVFGGDAHLAGLFLGTAIHDTAQVAGAGLLYSLQFGAPEALDTATVTKLVRNLFMIVVIPLVAYLYRRGEGGGTGARRPRLDQVVPFFVFGFLALVVLRTLGDLDTAPFGGWLSHEQWRSVIDGAATLSTWSLGVAMAAVGLGTNLRRLRTLGLGPLGVGLVAALSVGLVSAGLIHLLADSLI